MPEPRITSRQRNAVAARAGNCCEYCRSPEKFAVQSFSVEHIEPRSRRGASSLDNLALACQGCNNSKYNKVEGADPASDAMAPLFHPRRNRWSDHFTWSPDFTQVIGLTPTGRATIRELKLNREGLVNLRQLLYAAGKHPPSDEDPGNER